MQQSGCRARCAAFAIGIVALVVGASASRARAAGPYGVEWGATVLHIDVSALPDRIAEFVRALDEQKIGTLDRLEGRVHVYSPFDPILDGDVAGALFRPMNRWVVLAPVSADQIVWVSFEVHSTGIGIRYGALYTSRWGAFRGYVRRIATRIAPDYVHSPEGIVVRALHDVVTKFDAPLTAEYLP